MKRVSDILSIPILYRAWQLPFQEKKLAPFHDRNELRAIRRVLDVGCGPGTNAQHFLQTDYLGLDINEQYIASARSRYPKEFRAVDVTKFSPPSGETFDCILVNSLLHHLSDEEASGLLSSLPPLLAPDGPVHLIDLVVRRRAPIAGWVARRDRGRFVRPLEKLREMFDLQFDTVLSEPFSLTLMGITLWHMIYIKGRPKQI